MVARIAPPLVTQRTFGRGSHPIEHPTQPSSGVVSPTIEWRTKKLQVPAGVYSPSQDRSLRLLSNIAVSAPFAIHPGTAIGIGDARFERVRRLRHEL